jgi:hypothetical protein
LAGEGGGGAIDTEEEDYGPAKPRKRRHAQIQRGSDNLHLKTMDLNDRNRATPDTAARQFVLIEANKTVERNPLGGRLSQEQVLNGSSATHVTITGTSLEMVSGVCGIIKKAIKKNNGELTLQSDIETVGGNSFSFAFYSDSESYVQDAKTRSDGRSRNGGVAEVDATANPMQVIAAGLGDEGESIQ